MKCACALVLVASLSVWAQMRTGTITGTVQDTSGAAIPNATVTITVPVTGFSRTVHADAAGTFRFANVPFEHYALKVTLAEFQPFETHIDLHSAVPVDVPVKLELQAVATTVEVTAEDHGEMVEAHRTASTTGLDETLINRIPSASASRAIETLVATTPGWAPDDNGRMHPRGSESQVHWNLDGVPITENMSAIFATSLDARMMRSVEVLTGGIPAEFGDKLGGVVSVNTKSGLDLDQGAWNAGISFGGGSFSAGDTSVDFSTRRKTFGFLGLVSGNTTQRFLDPPSLSNLHNFGRTMQTFQRLDWQRDPNNLLKLTLMIGGNNFQVPNREEQHLAGQHQRQQLRDNNEVFGWQHIFNPNWLSSVSAYHRYSSSRLDANALAIPVVPFQSRSLRTLGTVGALSYATQQHKVKIGYQLTGTRIEENFQFWVTEPEAFAPIRDEAGRELPNPVLRFTTASPFRFAGQRWQSFTSAYAQDHWTLLSWLTIDAGLRWDRYSLLFTENQVSPRIGFAIQIPRSRTVLRGSYNRLYQTPPVENILLASSVEASRISPLVVLGEAPGFRQVQADKQHTFEVGIQQQLSPWMRIDVAIYHKIIRNMGDKDQFLDTGVIFPISIFAGRVTGVETRLETREVAGLRGSLSWANSRSLGITPVNGGLFLGEEVESLESAGLRFANDHDQRNSAHWQVMYTNKRTGVWTAVNGRHDSGYPVGLEEGATPALYASLGFDPALLREVNFERGRVRPRTILNFSIGADHKVDDRVTMRVQFDVQNLTDRLYLYNFESVFSGTHVGLPRTYSGRLSFQLK